MPSFGRASKKHRNTLHSDLKEIVDEAIKHIDFSIIWGYRNKKEQTKAFKGKFSDKPWPESLHNKRPSDAMDLLPYPKGYKTTHLGWIKLAAHIMKAAKKKGKKVRWGGFFLRYRNGKYKLFFDAGHFQLVKED